MTLKLRKKDRVALFKELTELLNKEEQHLEESSEYSAASFQVICDIGRNEYDHSNQITGMNQVREEALKLAKMFGDIKRQINLIKNLVESEKRKNNA